MTIFEALRQDHERQRELLEKLLETKANSQEREDLFAQAKTALQTHTMAEERCFYSPLLKTSTTQTKVRHSVYEHQEVDNLLKKLDETKPTSSRWVDTAKKLQDAVLHHVEEEEQEVFKLAGKALDKSQQESMGKAFREELAALR